MALRGLESLGAGQRCVFSGLRGSSKAFFIASALKTAGRPVLVVAPDEESAEAVASDLSFFLGPDDVTLYPSTELLPFESASVHRDVRARRMAALHSLSRPGLRASVASAANLMVKVMPREVLEQGVVSISTGDEYNMERLIERLSLMGYIRLSMVEERGEMSVRGGILDVFAPGLAAPLRIEFFGDEIDSIRSFDVATQRSIEKLSGARILPAGEAAPLGAPATEARDRLIDRAEALGLDRAVWQPLSERLMNGALSGVESLAPLFYEDLSSLFDHLAPDTLVFCVDPGATASAARSFEAEVTRAAERLEEEKIFFVDPSGLYLRARELDALLKGSSLVEVEPLLTAGCELRTESNSDLKSALARARSEMRGDPRHDAAGTDGGLHGDNGLLRPLAERTEAWLEDGWRVCITAHNRAQAHRTAELLDAYGIASGRPVISGARLLDLPEPKHARPLVETAVGTLSSGFRLPEMRLVVISEDEIFGEAVRRRAPPSKRADAFITRLDDLNPGDAVVHVRHGIGLYRGLERISVDGVESEFLNLEYRDGDRLYLPVWKMDLVGRYRGVEGRGAALDKLGGPGWETTRRKVKHSVERLAGELLKLYAERAASRGFAFSAPDALFSEFEAGFEFEETPDQARAIEECLRDMQAPSPMDRLVCGDVGYGKTEVAMRAAFKAVADSKQVAVLVPTTVLAEQHFSTFTKRFAPYPVTIEVLSRFKSAKEQRATVERLSTGRVDIVIGTHRLLAADVAFADLGLVVIDEEHRFGVAHKEKLKRLRKQVDVLAMTATPIPRTLHMSLASIRELSVINTPPEDRRAIRTRVIGFDERVIAEAIEREILRGGQVFFVHNRIESMGRMEEFLSRIAPVARIAVAHGRMKERELEETMLAFVTHDYDLLLCTSIIESGLDIPRANTIIIDRADRFGLADLYQLRGRVGRSSHRAYAYFICPPAGTLGADAARRIEVIRELSRPGAGFRVAMHDLEIRGAGELLGPAQSGAIAAVGFDLYASLLEEAVNERRGEEAETGEEPEINLRVSQYIPEDYVPDARQRLSLYKRLAVAASDEELACMADELDDRYGPMPALVENLLRTTALKLLLKRLGASELTHRGNRLYLALRMKGMASERERLGEKLLDMIKNDPERFRAAPGDRLVVKMPPGSDVLEEARYLLKELVRECYS